jgi:hypothetical protein
MEFLGIFVLIALAICCVYGIDSYLKHARLAQRRNLPPAERVKTVIGSYESFSKVIAVRCEHGDYHKLSTEFPTIINCFERIFDDRIYKHLTVSDKSILVSIFIRALKKMEKHNHANAIQLRKFVTKFIHRVLNDGMDLDHKMLIESQLEELVKEHPVIYP